MRSPTLASLLLGAPVTVLSQLVPIIAVGQNGLVYTPSSLTAPPGSQVEFQFYPHNHSVVSGSFDNPCQPDGRVFSGYMPISSGPGPDVFVITINDTSPIWFYCSQNGYTHCQNGMVGVINPPPSGLQTLAAYEAGSSRTTPGTSGDLPYVVGGVVEPLASGPTNGPSIAPTTSQSVDAASTPTSTSLPAATTAVSATSDTSSIQTASSAEPIFSAVVAEAIPTITYSACTGAASSIVTYSACSTAVGMRRRRRACG